MPRYAAIAIRTMFRRDGTSLSQPQVLTRYFAGRSAEETQAAKWIYICFIHFTWMGMTLFGVLAHGIMPGLKDSEAALPAFVKEYADPVLIGVVISGVYACIASTADSIIVALTSVVMVDLLGRRSALNNRVTFFISCVCIGVLSVALAIYVTATVYSLSLFAVSIMAAAIAPPMAIRVLKLRYSAGSLLAAACSGAIAALGWRIGGMSDYVNESAIGIPVAMVANYLYYSHVSKENTGI